MLIVVAEERRMSRGRGRMWDSILVGRIMLDLEGNSERLEVLESIFI